jgi:hypothetical protein
VQKEAVWKELDAKGELNDDIVDGIKAGIAEFLKTFSADA